MHGVRRTQGQGHAHIGAGADALGCITILLRRSRAQCLPSPAPHALGPARIGGALVARHSFHQYELAHSEASVLVLVLVLVLCAGA